MKKGKTYIALIICVLSSIPQLSSFCQDSRNGYWLPVKDTVRILLVYAEVVYDPDEPGVVEGWKPGTFPPRPSIFFDPSITEGKPITGMMTKYYHEASFGRFVLLGDYYPELISVNFSELTGDGFLQVIDKLNSAPGTDIVTANGFSLARGDFDHFTSASGYGMPKDPYPDNFTDMIMILWRVNSRITTTSSAGFCVPSRYQHPFKSSLGFNAYSCFVIKGASAYMGIRHEFSHTLLGGNNFHTGGAGAGTKTFMSSAGGYAMLSSWDRSSPVYNGLDRKRLGWKAAGNIYELSCRNPDDLSELNSDLVYGQEFTQGTNEFLLRDFVTSGDVIRIELPHLQDDNPKINQQWLWLENHQMKDGAIDHAPVLGKGIYAYVQVGKEALSGKEVYSGNCNYTWPLSAFGNYDFFIDTLAKSVIAREDHINPFTGYNFLIHGAYDLPPCNNLISRDELFFPEKVIVNSKTLDESSFRYRTDPLFGSVFDVFLPGMKIGIGENPAAVPVLTYTTPGYAMQRPGGPAVYDNRTVYLNGLSIEILEQYENGAVRLKILWDDYSVSEDTRWCGDMVLTEQILLQEKCTVRIDQGLTPQRPKEPQALHGQMIFADPSVLTCRQGSRMIMEGKSSLVLENNSKLILEPGSFMEIGPHARVLVLGQSALIVEPGAELIVHGKIRHRDAKKL
jgi:hypothetical protein